MATLTTRHEAVATRDIPARERRFRVDEVIRMAEAGIIAERERVELIDGRLIEMSPEGSEHARAVAALTTRVARLYPEGHEIRSQSTLPLDDHTYVEPDVLVVRPREDQWAWPRSSDVVLVAEVAHTSARRDRLVKSELYAAWGAPVYWIVDLVRREVVVHTDPGPEGYATKRTLTAGGLELPGIGGSTPIPEFLPPTG